ncbi:hypothetical protein SAMN05421778_11016 [Sphaerotilus natans]|uniref:hypothetical protein n=1 Tax=Sphaerotilus natans TaxID=34103 RepID=UPI00095596F2|nr:hypothetical protein [Sphaerotilus natans]SIR41544.1 hypothetical protein SAMN05421778_11016 [Sphaerotilus natans]
MSVGPGKIRVFRAQEIQKLPSRPAEKIQSHPKALVPIPTGTVRRIKRMDVEAGCAKQDRGALVCESGRSHAAPGRVYIRLLPTEVQRRNLVKIFQAPMALSNLLRVQEMRIKSKADASMFLLRNKKFLDTFLEPNARESMVDLLTDLLVQWSGDPPERVGIDFDDASLSSEQQLHIPIVKLRGVALMDPVAVNSRRKGLRYRNPFTVFEESGNFYVAFDLVRPENVSAKFFGAPKHAGSSIQPLVLAPDAPLPYIVGTRDLPREPRQRLLYSRYSGIFQPGMGVMNWGGLYGKCVNGGRPLLP